MAKYDYLDNKERRGYQWPASALTGREMAILNDWREKTGVSICELLRQSVEKINDIIINKAGCYGKMDSDKATSVAER